MPINQSNKDFRNDQLHFVDRFKLDYISNVNFNSLIEYFKNLNLPSGIFTLSC